MSRRWHWLLIAWIALAASEPAAAHAIGISRGAYQSSAQGFTATLVFAHTELATAISGLDSDSDGRISSAELNAHRSLLDHALMPGVIMRGANADCITEVDTAELTDNDGLQVALSFRCPPARTGYTLLFNLFDTLSSGHRHLATIETPSGATTQVLYQAAPSLAVARQDRLTTRDVGWPLVGLGIEHILTGYDHLVFLFGLLIVARRWRDLLGVITAFTVGHSITLAVATLGYWLPSPRLIEPLIALSIVYVGAENLLARKNARRWPLTLGFGLVHGFGFAGVLNEIALPSAQLPLALLAFNGGVELGQLLILVIALPIVFALRRRSWFEGSGVRTLSAMIALAGLGWFVERVL